jgi:hypothetical protein
MCHFLASSGVENFTFDHSPEVPLSFADKVRFEKWQPEAQSQQLQTEYMLAGEQSQD